MMNNGGPRPLSTWHGWQRPRRVIRMEECERCGVRGQLTTVESRDGTQTLCICPACVRQIVRPGWQWRHIKEAACGAAR